MVMYCSPMYEMNAHRRIKPKAKTRRSIIARAPSRFQTLPSHARTTERRGGEERRKTFSIPMKLVHFLPLSLSLPRNETGGGKEGGEKCLETKGRPQTDRATDRPTTISCLISPLVPSLHLPCRYLFVFARPSTHTGRPKTSVPM